LNVCFEEISPKYESVPQDIEKLSPEVRELWILERIEKFFLADDEACLAAYVIYTVLLRRAIKPLHFNVIGSGVLVRAKDKYPDWPTYIFFNVTRELARPLLVHARLYMHTKTAKFRIGMARRFDGSFLVGIRTKRLNETAWLDDIRICALIKQMCN
jgi:hypothetical protein